MQLSPGDRVFLFTDGITESRNAAGEEFGEDRLTQLALGMRSQKVAALPHRIIEAAADFSTGSLDDDATVVILAVN
ncbi:MAG TPA: SpoIIE family protein phosphatase [Acidobacteriota bacterium]